MNTIKDEENYNSSEDNKNNNIINIKKNSNKNLNIIKKSSKIIKKSFHRMQTTSKINFNNREEKNNKNFRIIKETFDPKKYLVSEEELFIKGEGYCFGEWALIYKELRTASVYTLEDCVFFTLDEVHFRSSFLKSLNNSEYSKKKFALQNFLPFDMMVERQLSIYKNIVPINCKPNQIIFNEGDISDSIYLIYLGSFILEKKYGLKQYKVLNLEKGSIVGLESIFEGENSKYKCSLRLSFGFDFGLIFQLKINKLRPYILNKMKICFKNNYNVFLKSFYDLFIKNVFVQQKILRRRNHNNEEGKNEFGFILNDNSERNEFIKNNFKNIVTKEPEDKYEILFKNCLKKGLYDNHKKDGTLRIFSSRQRNKIKEYYNDNKNYNINNNSKNINIIKYFKNNIKLNLEKTYFKTSNSFKNKLINSLNIHDFYSQSKRNCNNLKKINKSLNEKDKKISNIFINENLNTINKISINDNESIINNILNIKNNFNNLCLKSIKPFQKINKKLFLEKKIIKHNESNDYKDNNNNFINKNLKNNSNKNNLKNFKIKDKSIIDKINKKDSPKIKSIINNQRLIKKIKENENETTVDINNNIDDLSQNKLSNFKLSLNDKNVISRNYSFMQNFRYSLFEKSNLHENINSNSPIYNIKQNKFLFHSFKPSDNINNIKQLKTPIISRSVPRENNKYNNERISFSNRNERKNLSLVNSDSKRILSSLEKNNNKIIIRNTKDTKNKRFKSCKIIKSNNNNNIKYLDKKIKKYKINDSKNIYQEINGFSVSYFEKINVLYNMNNFNIRNTNKPFPSNQTLFKVSFDSGIFNIPLISSSVKCKK